MCVCVCVCIIYVTESLYYIPEAKTALYIHQLYFYFKKMQNKESHQSPLNQNLSFNRISMRLCTLECDC